MKLFAKNQWLCLLFFLTFSIATGQNSVENIKWDGQLHEINTFDTVVYTISCEGAVNLADSSFLPVIRKRILLETDEKVIDFHMFNKKFEPIEDEVVESIFGKENIPDQIETKIIYSEWERKPVAYAYFIPIRKNSVTGKLERLISYQFLIAPDKRQSPQHSYENIEDSLDFWKENSVLRSGYWYKISVKNNGIYKISHDQLELAGFTSSNPDAYRIFGNGNGMLPEDPNQHFNDDLVENAILVEDHGDGIFGPGDYILFYANGPDVWNYNESEKQFFHRRNYYSDKSYYFLTTDYNEGTAKRIQDNASLDTIATHTAKTFIDFAVHNKDDVNLAQTGKTWYGEEFGFNNQHSFSFSFPNVVQGSSMYLRISMAANSKISNKLSFNVNGYTFTEYIAPHSGHYYVVANTGVFERILTANDPNVNISITYTQPSSGDKAWLDYILLNAERNLYFTGSQMDFRNVKTIGENNITEFEMENANSQIKIWDISDFPERISNQLYEIENGTLRFTVPTKDIKTYIAFDGSQFFTPELEGIVENQNLHAQKNIDMVILVPEIFRSEAERLAEFHREHDNMDVLIVNPQEVYNEFSSGAQDVTAIRNFMKMLYQTSDESHLPRYLLLFGDASYDFKNRVPNNTNYVPTYESSNGVNHASGYPNDDYFGIFTSPATAIEIGIGRFPVHSVSQAKVAVDKCLIYASDQDLLDENDPLNLNRVSNYASWRNIVSFWADDMDDSSDNFIPSTEFIANNFSENNPEYNIDKIYLDAYVQYSTPGGERYPDVNTAINKRVEKGSLLISYLGHGGELGITHERVLGVTDINNWNNKYNLVFFITSTCELTRFDNPALTSAGEYMFYNPNGGAIGLMTTTRLAYASTTQQLARAFFRYAFEKTNGEYMRLGDIYKYAKSEVIDVQSLKNVLLIGNPALKLAYPEHKIKTTSINGNTVDSLVLDTLKAFQKVTIQGEVQSVSGEKMNDFNGVLFPTVFDKESKLTTLANDSDATKIPFTLRKNTLFKGKVSVTGGNFEFSFIVPKDISYEIGNGRISYYAKTEQTDANGYYEDFYVGGSSDNYFAEDQGPNIELFMNNRKFTNRGITDENPVILGYLSDSSGINTMGNGIGHDLAATIDYQWANAIVLNDYYETDLDSYQSGTVKYQLKDLDEGLHHIRLKAWDVLNNSSEAEIEFIVAKSAKSALEKVLNYPNPFSEFTNFEFEHNQAFSDYQLYVRIFNMDGLMVKELQAVVLSNGYKSKIQWDGTNDNGEKLGAGVYLYKIILENQDGNKEEKSGKIVIIR